MDEATKSPSENVSQESDTTSSVQKENHTNEVTDGAMPSPESTEGCQDLKVESDRQDSESEKLTSSIFSVEDNLDLTVFVGNLNVSVTNETFKNFLLREGLQTNDIKKVGVIWKFLKNSEERGITFVELASSSAFEVALTLNGRELGGNNVIIVPAVYSHRGLILLFSSSEFKMNDTNIDQNLCIENKTYHNEDINAKGTITLELDNNLHSSENELHQIQDIEAETHTVENVKDDSPTIISSKIALPDVFDLTDDSNCGRKDEQKVIDIEDSSVEEIYIAHGTVENEQNIEEDSKNINDEDEKQDSGTTIVAEEQICEPKSNINKNSVVDAISKEQEFTAIIRNLPPDTKEEELKEFFNITAEDIQSIRVLRHGRSRRSSDRNARAIITFTSEQCLNKCLAQTKSLFHYRQIFVHKHSEGSKLETGEKRQNSFHKSNHDNNLIRPSKIKCENEKVASDVKVELDLFVKHVHKNVSDRHLVDFFASAGAVVKKVYRFPDMNKVRGMAFTTMENTESVVRGLAMNGKMLYGVKIKVCIRNDRTHLSPPMKEDIVLSYSTFISGLPNKESADSLKNSLRTFFEKLGCVIKFINVPSAVNHSGNRGYAYVLFENEESLSKCQKLHRSEIVLNNSKSFIDVSKQWPELRVVTPSPTREKAREPSYSSVDSSLQGRQNKRRRKGISSPLSTWDNKLSSNLKPAMSKEYSQNTCDYPPDQLAVMTDSNLLQSEYNKYLDYMEISDYARKVYDNQAFTSYNSRGSAQCKQDYNSQTTTGQQTYSSLVPNSSVPSSLANMSEPLNIVQKTQLENEMRDYSQYRARDYMDRINYEDLEQPHLSASSYKWRESSEYVVDSHGVSADADVATTSKGRLNSTSLYRRSDEQEYEPASSLYNSRNQYFPGKETNSSYSSTLSGQVPSRNSWFDSSRSDYHSNGSNSFVSAQSSALHSQSGLPSARIPNDVPLFSRFDRRSCFNPLEPSFYPGSSGGIQKYSISANAATSRPLNEITHYGHHVLSSEEKRKSSAYENSSSFVSKLAQSGILSNAGYDSYPGVGGYREN